MNWDEKPQVKKGKIGEALVDEYLRSKGIVPYIPKANGAHPFDRLCASADKKRLYVAEVKTKPRRKFYPDTGFNEKNFSDYVHISMTYNMDVFVYFVDEIKKEIYGGELFGKLNQPRQVKNSLEELNYPWRHNGIIYFPLEAMEHIAWLSDEEVKELIALRTTKYPEET